MWDARLFSVALLFFVRFLGLPTLLWTIIFTYFRVLGLDFLMFSGLKFPSAGGDWVHGKRNTMAACSTRLPCAGWWGSAQARGICYNMNVPGQVLCISSILVHHVCLSALHRGCEPVR